MRFIILIVKNMRRNLVRSILTALGTMMLVFVVTLVWSILSFLATTTSQKAQNFKAIVTEKWQIPSQMPYTYAATLTKGAATEPGDIQPLDSMTWQFYGGSLKQNPAERTRDDSLFAIALEPRKLNTMMDELDSLPPEPAAEFAKVVQKMEENRKGIVIGRDRLKAIKKNVGDRITIYGLNYRDINLELDIVGLFPDGRNNNSAAINRDYLLAAMDAYEQKEGKPHPMMLRTLNLVWLKVPDSETFAKLDQQIENSPLYSQPKVKCETASSAVSTFLEAYRDLIWGMRWLLAPAILVTLSLVISNSISISVRERQTEIAVLKVLGFRPNQIMFLVLGEAVFLGVVAGFVSSGMTYFFVNSPPPYGMGGLKFPIAFFAAFLIPLDALWWGPVLGGLTAFIGSFFPAWNARGVRVSEVFSRVG